LIAVLCLLLAACSSSNVRERDRAAQGRAAEAPPAQPVPQGAEQPRVPMSTPPPYPVPATPPPGLPGAEGGRVILTPPPGVSRTIGVGLLLPLSGADAGIGRALLDAAQLAMFDVANDELTLLPRDTQGTPQGASAAAISAIDGGAQILLGPLFAGSVVEVAPLARAANLPVIAFSNDRAAAREDAFVIGFRPEAAVRRVVGYAASQGRRRFAALLPEDAFGTRVAEAFRESVAAAGGAVADIEFYGNSQDSIAAAVRRLAAYEDRRAAMQARRAELAQAGDELSARELRRLVGRDTLGALPFDAVLLAESGAALKALAPLLPFYDIDTSQVRVLGIDGRPGQELEREPSLSGAWFAGPSPDARKGFEERFRAVYGRPAHPLGVLAYDAASLAAVLATAEEGPAFNTVSLTAPNGFAGAAGTFRLLRDGLVERQLAVIELRPTGAVVVSPARTTFQPLGN
jgi:ABC-type branched-subunit amino acid transport system substrate-binding protein